jgi:hypothetical protein
MKLTVASAVAVLVAAAATPAMALVVPTTNPGTPSSTSLVLAIFDAAGDSETINLGYTYSQLINAGSAALSGAFSPDTLAAGAPAFTSAVVGGSNVLQVNFGAVSSDFATTFTGTTSYTVFADNAATPTAQIIGSTTAVGGTNNTLSDTSGHSGTGINALEGAASGTVTRVTGDAANSDFKYSGALAALLSSDLGATAATVGSNLNLYSLVAGAGRGATVPNVVTIFANVLGNGFFQLNGGTLTWNVPDSGTPVPLPAAAWLLTSGLAGLGLFGRRRGSVVAAAA